MLYTDIYSYVYFKCLFHCDIAPARLVFVKDSILRDRPTNERRRREYERARSASVSAEGARVRRRRETSAVGASLSPEAQRFREAESSLCYYGTISYRLQITLPVKIGYAPLRRSTDLLPDLTTCGLSPGIEFLKTH